jgi:hypothetical protein
VTRNGRLHRKAIVSGRGSANGEAAVAANMRTLSLLVIVLLATTRLLRAQWNDANTLTERDHSYSLLRENEDWSFLKDHSLRQDFWDKLKYRSLGRENWYFSIGGEIREVVEDVKNDNWGDQPYTNAFFLQRYMLDADWHFGSRVRAFVQVKSGLESYRRGGPRQIDEKKLDFEAAFVDIDTSGGKKGPVVRLGRQELDYGSGRLVSVREGPNVRQSFDGVKIRSQYGSWRIDGFAVRPDLDEPGYFNNVPDHRSAFWGIYATGPLRRGLSLDAYYLGLDRKQATFNRGTARELRHSLGLRLWRSVATQKRDWDFDYEGVWQFGCFGSGDIRAWTLASDTGYSFPTRRLRPRLSVKADISSGDDPRQHSLGTFNPIFPTGDYFGVLADTGPGMVNSIDLHPRLQAQFPHSVSVSVDFIALWRQNVHDGVYAVPGLLLTPAGNSRARFVGYRPGVEVRWQIDRHSYFQADYGVFYVGEFLKQSSPGRNINYLALWAGYRF